MPDATPRPAPPMHLGYDALRLGAIACVALQHILSISGIRPPAVGVVDLGQLGVTIFCALSGLFALRPGGSPLHWLWRRLGRIYPPYWITLAAILGSDWAVAYKPITPGLVASQVLGMALFTHPGQIIGVHLWFISLILVCYALGALLRWRRALLPAAVLAACLLPRGVVPAHHALSFLAGAAVATTPGWAGRLAIAVACLVALGAGWPGFAYPLVGTAAILAASLLPGPSPRGLSVASQASYEFFLVHGPVYLGLAHLAGFGLAGVLVVGTALSLVATWALCRADRVARSAVDGLVTAASARRKAIEKRWADQPIIR